MVEGMDPSKGLFIMNGGTVTISDGRSLAANDTGSYVAVVGSAYADDNGVGVGDYVTVGSSSFDIVGIYTSGTRFGDMTVIVPYQAAKAALGVSGPTTLYATADSVGNVDSVKQAIIDALGSDYDVTSANERGSEMQDTIDAIKGNSQMGAYLALVTGMAIMTFIMVLITRERFREIGILKAIGFKNSRIVTQLVTETMMLAAMGFVIGVVIAALVGPYLSTMVVSSSVQTPTGTTGGPPGGFGGGGANRDAGRASAGLFGADFALDPGLTALTLVMALVLGVVGSLYPVLTAIKLKPAEALRYE
jgi:putative ABC transport system permease protein